MGMPPPLLVLGIILGEEKKIKEVKLLSQKRKEKLEVEI
jgi:hypothetical protein